MRKYIGLIVCLLFAQGAVAEPVRFNASVDEGGMLAGAFTTKLWLDDCGISAEAAPTMARLTAMMASHYSISHLANYLVPSPLDMMGYRIKVAEIYHKTGGREAACSALRSDAAKGLLEAKLSQALHELRKRHLAAGHANIDDPAFSDVAGEVKVDRAGQEARRLYEQGLAEEERRKAAAAAAPDQALIGVKIRDALLSVGPFAEFGAIGKKLVYFLDDPETAELQKRLDAEKAAEEERRKAASGCGAPVIKARDEVNDKAQKMVLGGEKSGPGAIELGSALLAAAVGRPALAKGIPAANEVVEQVRLAGNIVVAKSSDCQ